MGHSPTGPLSGARAKAILLAALACVAALGAIGLGVEGRLQPTSLSIPGTAAARGEALAAAHFGPSSPFAVLLRGPAAAIERQGPALVAVLRHDSAATVLSPWDKPAVGGLPSPANERSAKASACAIGEGHTELGKDAGRGSSRATRPTEDTAQRRVGRRQACALKHEAASKALILVDFHVPLGDAMRHTVPALQRLLAARIRPPLVATQASYAAVSRGIQEESLGSAERAELIAAPLLILVLLLVFRSVVAAAIPLAFGALTVFSARGVLALLSSTMHIDALSLVVCSMMGLALGVDYSLFIVSRFREKLAEGKAPAAAALATRRTAGRTTVFAGSTLFMSIFLSAFLQSGPLLISLATALVVVIAISVLIAWVALPALLALLGERINAGRIGRRRGAGRRSRVATAAGAALRRPALAAVAIAVPLLALAIPAVGLATGAPGIDELPASSPPRQSAEAIDRAVGPGWEAPFVLVAATTKGPITTSANLALLARWQRRIAAEPDIKAVIGPAPIARATRPLRGLGARLASKRSDTPAQLARLGPGLHRAAGAVARLRTGLRRAADGSGLLADGAGRAGEGAGLLASGLRRAAAGGERASSAIGGLAGGSKRLAEGQRKARVAGLTLAIGLRSLLPGVRADNLARARGLAAEAEAAARSDPAWRKQASRARALVRSIAFTRDEVRRLRAVALVLHGGLDRLASGGARLQNGTGRLLAAAGRLKSGLRRLGSGAQRLAGGLGALQGGGAALQGGLAAGYRRSHPLQTRLRRSGIRVAAQAAPLLRGARHLQRDSPGLFDSGYFVLSALEGAPRRRRALAGEAVDLGGGGQAARMIVVPNEAFNTAGSRAVGARLLADSTQIARAGHLQTGVSGGAATVNDYAGATKARLPLVIGAIIAITFLMLVAILRAPLLAILAVVLNLASVAAAVGVMTLVCRIPAGYPLGGHPYIDTVGAAAIFGVTFGLSIDYAVFLLARMREKYDELAYAGGVSSSFAVEGSEPHARTREFGREIAGDDERGRTEAEDMRPVEVHRAAITFGLDRTAGVITGAATIMAAVFVSFATAPIATVSQMGVGLTVAILFDATVVRIVLLPALMLLVGERIWRVPPWLDRLLPQLNVHGMEAKP